MTILWAETNDCADHGCMTDLSSSWKWEQLAMTAMTAPWSARDVGRPHGRARLVFHAGVVLVEAVRRRRSAGFFPSETKLWRTKLYAARNRNSGSVQNAPQQWWGERRENEHKEKKISRAMLRKLLGLGLVRTWGAGEPWGRIVAEDLQNGHDALHPYRFRI